MIGYHIHNVLIVDGGGGEPYNGDLLTRGDAIEAILPPSSPLREGYTPVDADSKLLCPGFIDMHSHSDLQVLRSSSMPEKIGQGITTEVVGNCGIGVFPANKGSRFLQELSSDVLGSYPEAGWPSFSDYRQAWEKQGSGTNMAFLQAHSTLRRYSMTGSVNRPANEIEIERMCSYLGKSLEEGCIGMSSGLYYAPCIFAEEKELLRLLEVLASFGSLFSVHMRCEGSDIIASLKEVLSLAERSGVRLEISHLKIIGKKNQHLVDQVLSLIEQSRKQGLDVQFDQYPYTYGSTSLFSFLPPSFLHLPRKELQPLLGDPEARKTIQREMENPQGWDSLADLCGWDQVRILRLESNSRYEQMSITEIAEKRNSDPWNTFFDLLQAEKGIALMTDVTQSEETLQKILCHPLMCFGTDALYTGSLAHPRSYQAAVHLLYQYGKRNQVLPVEGLVARMSGRPAKRLGLTDRGKLEKGYKADLVLLDWERLKDNSDPAHPDAASEGISLVMVNGQIAYKDGIGTGSRSGRIILTRSG